jgi:A/G-specific adenine glycosylase
MTLAVETASAKRRPGRKPAIPKPPAAPDPRKLLAWYDRERRELPWRAPPGRKADPYRVWLSEIMLQQTRVETVARYYERFLARYPTVKELAASRLDSVLRLWAGLGYYARARNLHACAREVVRLHGGKFPPGETELRALPGIGAYTSAAISAIAFGRKAAPVDGNIERVLARLYAVETPLPAAKRELRQLAEALVPDERAGDFAQAMMDLGATICTPKRPACPACPWQGACIAFRRGGPEEFPRRVRKADGRLRRGAAFVVLRADGAILLRRRPQKGLLGGMIEVPTTEWTGDYRLADAPREASRMLPLANGKSGAWRLLPGVVRHVFTHFPLELAVFVAGVPKGTRAPRGMRFVAREKLESEALPTLMRKVIGRGLIGGKANSPRGRA